MKVSLLALEGLSPSQLPNWKREMQLIAGPVVVISTIDREGIPNVALKTNFMILRALARAFKETIKRRNNRL